MNKNTPEVTETSSAPKIGDIYDQEIATLTKYPERIYDHWNGTSPLFSKAGRPGVYQDKNNLSIGCLTQIKITKDSSYIYVSEVPSFTEEIYADDRIPGDAKKISLEMLPVFADYQRRLDAELNRVPRETFSYNHYPIYQNDGNDCYESL